MPRRGRRGDAGVGGIGRRDQDALDTLLFQQVEVGGPAVRVVATPAAGRGQPRATSVKNALGVVQGGLPELRALLTATQPLTHHAPSGDEAAWAAAERRLSG